MLDDISIEGASAILVNVTGSKLLGIKQISKAASIVNSEAGPGAHVFLGTVIDDTIPDDEVRVTVIATGFHRPGMVVESVRPQTDVARPAAPAHVETTGPAMAPMADVGSPPDVVPAPVQGMPPATQGVPAGSHVPAVPVRPDDPAPEIRTASIPVQPVAEMPPAGAFVAPEMPPAPAEINFAELLEGDRTVIELDTESAADVAAAASTEPEPKDETVVMDNGSIRSFNTDGFRIPTFVRKQMD